METSGRISLFQAFDYEIRAAGWPARVSVPWMQNLAARYFAWKVRRKYTKYVACCDEADRVHARAAESR